MRFNEIQCSVIKFNPVGTGLPCKALNPWAAGQDPVPDKPSRQLTVAKKGILSFTGDFRNLTCQLVSRDVSNLRETHREHELRPAMTCLWIISCEASNDDHCISIRSSGPWRKAKQVSNSRGRSDRQHIYYDLLTDLAMPCNKPVTQTHSDLSTWRQQISEDPNPLRRLSICERSPNDINNSLTNSFVIEPQFLGLCYGSIASFEAVHVDLDGPVYLPCL